MNPFIGRIRIPAHLSAIAVSGLCLLGLSTRAQADLTVITHMSMSGAVMKNLPAAAQANINDVMSESTTFVSGKKYRVTTALLSIIVDHDKNQVILLNDTHKTYTIVPLDPNAANRFATGGGAAVAIPNAAGADYDVEDTGRSTTLLGHKVRHYVVTVHMDLPNQGEMSVREDILAAQDFPEQEMETFNSLTPAMPGTTQIKGVPLKTVSTTTGGILGGMTTTQEVISISTKPIPAYFFTIPEGYTQVQSPQSPPGTPPSPSQ